MTVVKINAIAVPAPAHAELERRFGDRAGVIDGAPGFRGFKLLRPVAGEDRYFVVTEWDDDASFEAWRDGDARAAHKGEHGPTVTTGANLLEFEVVLDVAPSGD
ncbi:MAG: antibiotic biosynthesis monooxygenase [Actinobacteria bacterium]|nr:antibiotic biosynthesis monooxygenase [Actinomycetota bacterium]